MQKTIYDPSHIGNHIHSYIYVSSEAQSNTIYVGTKVLRNWRQVLPVSKASAGFSHYLQQQHLHRSPSVRPNKDVYTILAGLGKLLLILYKLTFGVKDWLTIGGWLVCTVGYQKDFCLNATPSWIGSYFVMNGIIDNWTGLLGTLELQ